MIAHDDSDIIKRARALVPRSHAPYSKFKAAAVAVCDSGIAHPGVIVENVSLGLAMCAERVAMFNAVAHGGRPTVVALAAPSTAGGMTWPCGACLQVALELGGPSMRFVVGDTDDGDMQSASVADLLPRGPHTDR